MNRAPHLFRHEVDDEEGQEDLLWASNMAFSLSRSAILCSKVAQFRVLEPL